MLEENAGYWFNCLGATGCQDNIVLFFDDDKEKDDDDTAKLSQEEIDALIKELGAGG